MLPSRPASPPIPLHTLQKSFCPASRMITWNRTLPWNLLHLPPHPCLCCPLSKATVGSEAMTPLPLPSGSSPLKTKLSNILSSARKSMNILKESSFLHLLSSPLSPCPPLLVCSLPANHTKGFCKILILICYSLESTQWTSSNSLVHTLFLILSSLQTSFLSFLWNGSCSSLVLIALISHSFYSIYFIK